MSYTELEVKKIAKSRKKYRCVWCDCDIDSSTEYISRSFVYEGSIGRDHWHPECWDAIAKCEDDLTDGWSPGDYPRGGVEAFANMP